MLSKEKYSGISTMVEFSRIEKNNNVKRIVIIGGGRSLSGFNFGILAKTDCFVIVVNDLGDLVPFADAWFTLDPWGLYGPQLPSKKFKGKLYAAVPEDFGTPVAQHRYHRILPTADISYLKRITNPGGLSEDPSIIYTGNSGFGAFGMAYHMRPEKILLLGIDGDIGYFYTKRKVNRTLKHLPEVFNSCLPQLEKNNIKVINGSSNSTITCFTRYTPTYAVEQFLS